MSQGSQSKRIAKIFGNVKVYHKSVDNWVFLRPTEIGDIKYSINQQDHNGWMICDGRSLSRTEYSDLFAIIGTSFGSNNSTTFKLPDNRGRVMGGIGQASGLTNRHLGDSVGEETHTLTISEMPSHSHTINDPGHSHSYVNNVNDQSVNTLTTQNDAADQADITQSTGTSTTGITINATGGGNSHNNMQPTLFIGNTFVFGKYNEIENWHKYE